MNTGAFRPHSRGFTLIELMIVVAIIAILAAIALPAYQDYTIRSQVSEGITLASGARSAVWDYVSNTGGFPSTNQSAGLVSDTSITGPYVTSVRVANGGITVTYGNKVNAKVAGQTIEFSPALNDGSIQWVCTGGSLNARYRSSPCR